MLSVGEVLEKVTRVLTDAEKAQMEVEFVGKNGQRRKLEVSFTSRLTRSVLTTSRLVDHGSPKTEEVFPIRDQVARYVNCM